MTSDLIPHLYTPVQAAHLLALSRSKIYELMDADALPSVKLGRSRRIRREALEAFVAAL